MYTLSNFVYLINVIRKHRLFIVQKYLASWSVQGCLMIWLFLCRCSLHNLVPTLPMGYDEISITAWKLFTLKSMRDQERLWRHQWVWEIQKKNKKKLEQKSQCWKDIWRQTIRHNDQKLELIKMTSDGRFQIPIHIEMAWHLKVWRVF